MAPFVHETIEEKKEGGRKKQGMRGGGMAEE